MGRRVEKPWGSELIWAETPRYAGKVLFIGQGKRLSLQLHERKDESILLLRGRLELELENESGGMESRTLLPGESCHIPVGRRHRFGALEDCELVEVSTPELDDVVRFEDDFGRAPRAAE